MYASGWELSIISLWMCYLARHLLTAVSAEYNFMRKKSSPDSETSGDYFNANEINFIFTDISIFDLIKISITDISMHEHEMCRVASHHTIPAYLQPAA